MTDPLVSVLMTAYNRETYIAEAIESVLASDFTDFELIVVDDASRDATAEIARRYSSDRRVRVHVNEHNLGDYPNRNRAASHARGRYLKYVDSDDKIYPHGLSVMREAMERFPDAVLGLCRLGGAGPAETIYYTPAQAYRREFLSTGLLHSGPTGSIIRSHAFRDVGGFSGKRFIGDVELWLRLSARYPILTLQSDLVSWRSHANQEMRYERASLAQSHYLRFEIHMTALESPDCPLSQDEKSRGRQILRRAQARNVWHLSLRERRMGEAFRLFRSSRLTVGETLRALTPIRFNSNLPTKNASL